MKERRNNERKEENYQLATYTRLKTIFLYPYFNNQFLSHLRFELFTVEIASLESLIPEHRSTRCLGLSLWAIKRMMITFPRPEDSSNVAIT